MLFHQRHLAGADRQRLRHQQRLAAYPGLSAGLLQPFVGDALVSGVHIHQHQPVAILGQDIHAVKLGQRIAQRWHGVLVGGLVAVRLRTVKALIAGRRIGAQRASIRASRAGGGTRPARQVRCRIQRRFADAGRRGLAEAHFALVNQFAGEQIEAAGRRRDRRRRVVGAGAFGAQVGQRFVQRAVNKAMHAAPLAKAHLVLARVHVHIDIPGVQLQIQHKRGMPGVVQHIGKGLAHGVRHQLVANVAAVDEEVLEVGLAAGEGRLRDPAAQRQAGGLALDLHGVLDEAGATEQGDAAQALGGARAAAQLMQRTAVVAQGEMDLEARQGHALEGLFQMLEFGALRAQKLAPRGRIEEQIAHFYGGAARVRRGRHGHRHVAPRTAGAVPATALGAGIAGQFELRYGADAGQRFAAKTEAAHPLQVFQRGDLAGRVAIQGQGQIVLRDPAAVVAQSDQARAGGLYIDVHALRARVETVLEEFLEHRRRSLDDLAGGNLIGQTGRKALDRRHRQQTPLSSLECAGSDRPRCDCRRGRCGA